MARGAPPGEGTEMKRYTGPLLAALLPIVGVGALAVAPAATSAATSTSTSSGAPNWSSLEQTALGVTAGARGDGTLDVVGGPSSVAQSTITTASGPVSLAQQTVVATDQSGVVVLDLALLGGRQLVVSEMSPAANDQGETLVLAPGTSTVTGTYRLAGASQATAQTADPADGVAPSRGRHRRLRRRPASGRSPCRHAGDRRRLLPGAPGARRDQLGLRAADPGRRCHRLHVEPGDTGADHRALHGQHTAQQRRRRYRLRRATWRSTPTRPATRRRPTRSRRPSCGRSTGRCSPGPTPVGPR